MVGVGSLFAVVLGILAAFASHRARLPGGPLIGAFIAVAALYVLVDGLEPVAPPVRTAAQLLIGISIGSEIKWSAFRSLRRFMAPLVLVFLLLFSVGLLFALVLSRATDLGIVTAVLSLAPGGATDMSVAALELNREATIVAGLHLVRQLVIYAFLAFIIARVHGVVPPSNLEDG